MNTESIDDEEKFGLGNQHGLHEMTGYTMIIKGSFDSLYRV